jgi:ABC-type transport system involved in Fe-S cluster assembly fused permease/ATPase subunit
MFPLGPDWHQQHSSSEKSFIIGKSRGRDKYINETLFGVLPALTELGLAVGCAFQRVGLYYASMLALNSGCNIMITLWSAGHAAKLERAKEDAKHHIVDVRLVGILINCKGC